MTAANLRAVGTDPAAPSEGQLVGTAEVAPIGDPQAGIFPELLTTHYDDQSNVRLFVFAAGGMGTPPEYIETIPTAITVTP